MKNAVTSTTQQVRPNVEAGFPDRFGTFHPIRASRDYNEFKTTDVESPADRKERKRRRAGLVDADYNMELHRRAKQRIKEFTARPHKQRAKVRSLSQFVRARGGIAPTTGSDAVALLSPKQTGTSGLINKHSRQGAQKFSDEYMMDAANVEGYRDKYGDKFEAIGDFLMAVADDASGLQKLYTTEDLDTMADISAAVAYENPALEVVTPAQAKNWLATATSKADMVQSRVTKLAKEMKAGRYKAKSPLLFKGGKLVDGRHRLEAVVKSGKAVRFPVERVTAARARARANLGVIEVAEALRAADYLDKRLEGRARKNSALKLTAADLKNHPELAKRLGVGGESSAPTKRAAPVNKVRLFKVSRYSPKLQRRVSPPATFEGTKAGAIAEAKVAIGYDDLKRRRAPLPVNFIATEVRANPKRRLKLNPDTGLQVAAAGARKSGAQPQYALQIVDTARNEANAKQILRGLLTQADFIGGRVLAPGKGSGWRVQGFFKDSTGDVAGLGIKRVLHPKRVPAVWRALTLRRASKKNRASKNPIVGAGLKLLARLADQDMRRANKEGAVLIDKTKRGTVRLSVNPHTHAYTLASQGGDKWRFSGSRAQVKAQLVKLYQAVEGNPAPPARVAEVGKTFLGRDVQKVGTGVAAPGTPGHLQSNGLAELKVKGYAPFQFNAKRARMGIDGNGGLHLVNVKFGRPKEVKGEDDRVDYGEIEWVIYFARKNHLANGKPSYWKHPLGEMGGKKPHLQVDYYGWPYIVGGAYTIESAGICD